MREMCIHKREEKNNVKRCKNAERPELKPINCVPHPVSDTIGKFFWENLHFKFFTTFKKTMISAKLVLSSFFFLKRYFRLCWIIGLLTMDLKKCVVSKRLNAHFGDIALQGIKVRFGLKTWNLNLWAVIVGLAGGKAYNL